MHKTVAVRNTSLREAERQYILSHPETLGRSLNARKQGDMVLLDIPLTLEEALTFLTNGDRDVF